jgi:protein-disulfide isomerase
VSKGPTLSRREGLVLAGLLGAAGGGLLLARTLRKPWRVLPNSPTLQAAQAAEGPEAGNPNGDLLLIVFTDFNCAACRRAHLDMLAAVAADGRVRLRFLDWPVFGEDSRAAARTALAAQAQGLYLPVHKALMQGGRADAAAAEAAVVAAGGSLQTLHATLAADGPAIEGRLSRNAFHAFSLGLRGTPSHLIGPLLLEGAATEQDFRRAFAAAREA